ncbi:MAG TPA: histidine phosphatase family protein [Deinococcales bacterium]|nr:histidine phosphatase family protein [Deinococcales bacterium]
MTLVHLVRHGRHVLQGGPIVGRTAGIGLGDAGRAEAERAAARLSLAPLEAVYCSPLQRTRETAAIIAAPHREDAIVLDGLNEVAYGEWTGLTLDELRPLLAFQRWNDYRSGTRVPGGESMLEVLSRAAGALDDVRSRHPGSAVAVVTHGDVIRALLLHYLGAPLDLLLRLEVSTGSVSTVELSDHGPRVLAVNLT